MYRYCLYGSGFSNDIEISADDHSWESGWFKLWKDEKLIASFYTENGFLGYYRFRSRAINND